MKKMRYSEIDRKISELEEAAKVYALTILEALK